jgi:hypothetical protein
MGALRNVLVIAAAVAFGVLTWSMAHLLTYALFAHAHDDATAHVDDGAGPLMVATSAFVATLVISASFSVGSPRPRWNPLVRRGWLAAAAPVAFLAIEWIEHLAAGNGGQPAALVTIGVLVHATMGAATPLLWSGFVRRAILGLPTSHPATSGSGDEGPARAPDRVWTPWSSPSGTPSRAPPAIEVWGVRPCQI